MQEWEKLSNEETDGIYWQQKIDGELVFMFLMVNCLSVCP